MTNQQITTYLTGQRNELEKAFNAFPDKESIFLDVYSELKRFDFNLYKSRLEKEIYHNLKEWWTNPDKGIVKEEELFAILFEYDYFYRTNVDAAAYGIGKWDDFEVHTEEFDMGSSYDFTTEFYASPGVTLDFFDPLERLDWSKLPEQYNEKEIDEFDGFAELIGLYKFSGMLAIHEVLMKMDADKAFEAITYKNNFMFIIDEHDTGEVYPLLIKDRS